jgi:hypothetical protein
LLLHWISLAKSAAAISWALDDERDDLARCMASETLAHGGHVPLTTYRTASNSPPAPLIKLFDLPQRLIDTLSRRSWRKLQTLFQDDSIDKPKHNNFVDKSAIFLSTDDDQRQDRGSQGMSRKRSWLCR